MKVAVYAIAKNEEDNVKEWYESCKDADEVVLVDTGSDDSTYVLSQSLGIKTYKITVNPWRFDVARNASLSLVSEDIDFCIALDLDERLQPNWREAFNEVKISTTRIKYRVSYIEDGIETMRYWANRCHHRHNYRWEFEIHETPVYAFGQDKQVTQFLDFDVHHEQDKLKERPYTEMLKSCTERFPEDLRYSWLYARELLNAKEPELAYDEFQRYIKMPGKRSKEMWADIFRYMGLCYINPVEDFCESLLYSKRRETYIDLAIYFNDRGNWEKCLKYCDLAFEITEAPREFIIYDYAWGGEAYSMASMAAMNLLEYDRAKQYVAAGLSGGRTDEKLLNNLKLIEINQMMAMV